MFVEQIAALDVERSDSLMPSASRLASPVERDERQREVAVERYNVILVGHTHLPFMTRFGTRTVVNPGSLGQPKDGGPDASSAVWENGEFTLREVRYPVERTVATIAAQPLPADIVGALSHLLTTGSPPKA